MPPTPSLLQHDYEDSSPDPLATLIDEGNACDRNESSNRAKCTSISPSKSVIVFKNVTVASPHRARRTATAGMDSPSKTPPEQPSSPWRIRVTVEAESENGEHGYVKTTTRTTKVPLKETSLLAESAKAKPRKSRSVKAKSRRSGTLTTGPKSENRAKRQTLTDWNSAVPEDEDDDRSQKTPKRGTRKEQARKEKIWILGSEEPGKAAPTNVREEDHSETLANTAVEVNGTTLQMRDRDVQELREINHNRVSLRPRHESFKQQKADIRDYKFDAFSQASNPSHPIKDTSRQVSRSSIVSYPTPSSSVQDEVEPTALPSDPTEEHEGFDTILESEGFTMIDVQSLPSTRSDMSGPADQFLQTGSETLQTQVNLLFEPSAHHSLSPDSISPLASPTPPQEVRLLPKLKPPPIQSEPIPAEGDSDLSSTVPSSPPLSHMNLPLVPDYSRSSHTQETPQKLSPSPKPRFAPFSISLPSITLQTTNHQQVKSLPSVPRRGVKSSLASQSVSTPGIASTDSKSAVVRRSNIEFREPEEILGDLFTGFDSGTRRELRAGLKLGEELAKRPKSSRAAESFKEVAKPTSQKGILGDQSGFQHTPLGLPSLQEDMVEKREASASNLRSRQSKRLKQSLQHSGGLKTMTPPCMQPQQELPRYLDTENREKQWQMEREAVSRQIRDAHTDQIVLIESDYEDEDELDAVSNCLSPNKNQQSIAGDETDGDIWLAEAESHSKLQNRTQIPKSRQAALGEEKAQNPKANDVTSKPKKGVIASLCKKNETIDGRSSPVTNEDMSGLFWQKPRETIQFGARAIESQRQLSDHFKIGRMTPKRGGNDRSAQQAYAPQSLPERSPCENKPHAGADTSYFGGPEDSEDMGRDDGEVTFDQRHIEDDDDEDEDNEADVRQGSLIEPDDDKEEEEEGEERGQDVEESTFGQGERKDEDKEARLDAEDTSSNDDSTLASPDHGASGVDHETSSFPSPTPTVKVPVNFNDSTHSQSAISLGSSTSSSPGLATPRSALKGSRSSFGLEDSHVTRRVVFSSQSQCIDESGQESSLRLKSLSPTPPPTPTPNAPKKRELEVNETSEDSPRDFRDDPATAQPDTSTTQTKGKVSAWFGWLWGSSSSSAGAKSADFPVLRSELQPPKLASRVSRSKVSDNDWQATKSTIASSSKDSAAATITTTTTTSLSVSSLSSPPPRYLLPPSYPTDPKRNPSIPLSTSGDFTNTHFRTLHMLYKKSLASKNFHAPRSVRSGLKRIINSSERFEYEDPEYGLFEWRLDYRNALVLERFCQEVEWGWLRSWGREWRDHAGEEVEWGWSESELCDRLFMVMVGEEVRREERESEARGERRKGGGWDATTTAAGVR